MQSNKRSEVSFRDALGASVDRQEVEDEVLEAVEEAKAEEPKVEEPKVEEVKVEEVKVEEVKVEELKYSLQLIKQLRRKDPVDKKTCRVCARRVPLGQIAAGKSEVCDDCK